MIKLICHRGVLDESSFRKQLLSQIKANIIHTVKTVVKEFSLEPYSYWPNNVGLLLSLPPELELLLYERIEKNYTALEAVGLFKKDDKNNILDELKVFAFRYYEGFRFIFIAANSEEEAIDVLSHYLNKEDIDKNYLNLIDDAKIETIPEIIKTVDL